MEPTVLDTAAADGTTAACVRRRAPACAAADLVPDDSNGVSDVFIDHIR